MAKAERKAWGTSASDARTYVITPPGRFNLDVGELWRERELLYFLAARSIKVRYKQTLAGPAWAVFQPLLSMVIFTIVFGHFAQLPSNGLPYPVFYYSGLVLWTYFANAVIAGAGAIVENQQLVSKVYFPRTFLPLTGPVASLVDLAVATVVCIPIFIAFGHPPAWTAPLALVGALVALVAASGVSLFLGALNAKYRDVRFTVPFLIQAGMFASPVAYATTLVPAQWRDLYALNPMVGAIETFRWALTGRGEAPLRLLAVSAVSALVMLAVGAWYFQRVEGTIADVV
jgi:lipopolysaccharide transport system permease protein